MLIGGLSMDCLFCKIVEKSIPAKLIYEDPSILAFDDIRPAMPIHKLIIPKRHIASLAEAKAEDAELLGRLQLVAQKLAHELAVTESGYRVVMNINQHGGQTVYHIHLHLLAGRQMTWPPG
jgi:histidine triad (HIT) family protein